MSSDHDKDKKTRGVAPGIDRRGFLQDGTRIAGAITLSGLAAFLAGSQWAGKKVAGKASGQGSTVWQIDPSLCIACGRCETECVLDISAVKCYHNAEICGFCNLCSGYFEADAVELESGAENHMCPTNAIIRRFIEDPYYEFEIVKEKCIGCGKCVKGCVGFGNGSMFLQIDHDDCVHCNECAIARRCPSQAIRRVAADDAYLLKQPQGEFAREPEEDV